MQTLNKGFTGLGATGLILLTLVTGCAEWNSVPVVVDQNFGRAYHNMVSNQTLYPGHGQNDKPLLSLDGQKAEGVINAYRAPASETLEKSKQGVNFSVRSVGGGSTGN